MIFTKICVGCISRERDTRAWAISFLFWGGLYVFFSFLAPLSPVHICIPLFWLCVLKCQLLCSRSSSAYWIAYLHATDNNKNLYRLPPHPLFAWCNNNQKKENGLSVYTFTMAEMKWKHDIKIQETHHKKILKTVKSEGWQGEICLLTCSTQTLVVRIWFFRSCRKKKEFNERKIHKDIRFKRKLN